MKTLFNTIVTGLSMAILLLSCTKEGGDGPQGPQGPPGNPGEAVGSGETADVKAYTFSKTLAWKYHTSGGASYLVDAAYTQTPSDYDFHLEEGEVDEGDVVLTYLELTGPKTFWVQLNHTFQVPATTRFETYRVVPFGSLLEGYHFRIRADMEGVTTPYYQVKSLRVIVIPPGNVGTIGNRVAQSSPQLTLEEAMKKYHLTERDFKTMP